MLDWPFPVNEINDCNFVVHSDGGRRQGSSSSSAWIVEAGVISQGRWEYKPYIMGGTCHPRDVSSFTAESLALEEASLVLKRIFEAACEPLGKRHRT